MEKENDTKHVPQYFINAKKHRRKNGNGAFYETWNSNTAGWKRIVNTKILV